MANRTGILASRYAYINEPQTSYTTEGGRYTGGLDSQPIPELADALAVLSKPSDINSQHTHTPDPSYTMKRNDINASRYAPENYNKPENVAFRQSAYKYSTYKTAPVDWHFRPKTATPTPRAPASTYHGNGQLPYKVQHRVLTAIQTLLEEACYDYAVKWLPHILEERNWDCSEAVEMAKWKTVLSGPLPEGSITLSGRYSINQRLAEAVRIRNVTAHREPRDNNDIRKMISSAQNLVEIFSDDDRVNKLGRLRDEIDDWERSDVQRQVVPMKEISNGKDRDPRRKLHDALQEITDHPFAFDEMDWAPDEDVPKEHAHANVEEVGDEMEWE